VNRKKKWRRLFESGVRLRRLFQSAVFLAPKYVERYDFSPPATEQQLDAAEQALGMRLPTDVREMLSEFNGVWSTSEFRRSIGFDRDIVYLDINHITLDIPEHFRTCGDVLPPEEHLRKVVFVYQSNGFSDLYGVCAEDVAGFRAGEVVKLDHEVGELERGYSSLRKFVRWGPK
jgi:hypothetical protein